MKTEEEMVHALRALGYQIEYIPMVRIDYPDRHSYTLKDISEVYSMERRFLK